MKLFVNSLRALAFISFGLHSMDSKVNKTNNHAPLQKGKPGQLEKDDEVHKPWVYKRRINIYAVIAGKDIANSEQWYFTKRVVSKAKKSE